MSAIIPPKPANGITNRATNQPRLGVATQSSDPIGPIQADKRGLEGSADIWATVLVVATVALTIGVIMEIIGDLAELVEDIRSGKTLRWYTCAMFGGALIVFICCGVEGFAEFKGGIFESRLRTDDANIESVLTNRVLATAGEARDAKTNAGLANGNAIAANTLAQGVKDRLGPLSGRIGVASTRLGTLSANETALNAKLTNAERDILAKIEVAQARLAALTKETSELEDAASPREMEQGSVARAVAPFASVPVFLMTDSVFGDPEFTAYLGTALGMGKLHVTGLPPDGRAFLQGITIEYGFDPKSGRPFWEPAPAHDAARTLCIALSEQHLEVSIRATPTTGGEWNPAVPTDAMVVRVGKKESHFFENRMLVAKGARPIPTEREILSGFPGEPHPECG